MFTFDLIRSGSQYAVSALQHEIRLPFESREGAGGEAVRGAEETSFRGGGKGNICLGGSGVLGLRWPAVVL